MRIIEGGKERKGATPLLGRMSDPGDSLLEGPLDALSSRKALLGVLLRRREEEDEAFEQDAAKLEVLTLD